MNKINLNIVLKITLAIFIAYQSYKVYSKVVWVSLDRFYDDFEYKDIVSIVREQKLKEIGI